MDIQQIQQQQRDFDSLHGWSTEGISSLAVIEQLEQDLIGLVGEIGEAANILKKVRLETKNGSSPQNALRSRSSELKEELVDSFIYLLRLFDLSGVDIEKDYLAKLEENRNRFRKYEKK